VWRRFTDFEILQEYLLLFKPAQVVIFQVPEKESGFQSLVGYFKTNTDVIEQRVVAFNRILMYLKDQESLWTDRVWRAFYSSDKPFQEYLVAEPDLQDVVAAIPILKKD
jgi:hypothetical protein